MLPRPSLSRAVKQQGHVQVLHGDVEEPPGALDASRASRAPSGRAPLCSGLAADRAGPGILMKAPQREGAGCPWGGAESRGPPSTAAQGSLRGPVSPGHGSRPPTPGAVTPQVSPVCPARWL